MLPVYRSMMLSWFSEKLRSSIAEPHSSVLATARIFAGLPKHHFLAVSVTVAYFFFSENRPLIQPAPHFLLWMLQHSES